VLVAICRHAKRSHCSHRLDVPVRDDDESCTLPNRFALTRCRLFFFFCVCNPALPAQILPAGQTINNRNPSQRVSCWLYFWVYKSSAGQENLPGSQRHESSRKSQSVSSVSMAPLKSSAPRQQNLCEHINERQSFGHHKIKGQTDSSKIFLAEHAFPAHRKKSSYGRKRNHRKFNRPWRKSMAALLFSLANLRQVGCSSHEDREGMRKFQDDTANHGKTGTRFDVASNSDWVPHSWVGRTPPFR